MQKVVRERGVGHLSLALVAVVARLATEPLGLGAEDTRSVRLGTQRHEQQRGAGEAELKVEDGSPWNISAVQPHRRTVASLVVDREAENGAERGTDLPVSLTKRARRTKGAAVKSAIGGPTTVNRSLTLPPA